MVGGIVGGPEGVAGVSRSWRRGRGLEGGVGPGELGRVMVRWGRRARARRTVSGSVAQAPVRVDVIDTDRH